MNFVEASPGEAASRNRPFYCIFEVGTFTKPEAVRKKLAQLEDQLEYLREKQKKRQQREEISIVDIVAVAGVVSCIEMSVLKGVFGGKAREMSSPNCARLAKEGRLLIVSALDPFEAMITIKPEVREGTHPTQ